MVQAVDNGAVAALAVLKPFRNSCDGGLAQSRGALYFRIRFARRKHSRRLEALAEFLNLVFRHKVTQKTPRLFGRTQGK